MIGFAGNPHLGMKQPPAAAAHIAVPAGLVEARIVLNYRRGMLSFGPLEAQP